MNWMKKGPELKLPEIKVPDFLLDLYHDLKERRLLPLVALLAVAIIAVPIMLSQSSESSPTAAGVQTPSVAGSSGPSSSELVVAKSAPGLRDYRRRLRRARALDPFQQQYAESTTAAGEASASGSAPSSSGSSSGESSVSFGETSTPPASVAPESSSGGATGEKTQAKYATNTINVRIVSVPSGESAAQSSKKAQVHHDVPELTMLPDRDTPAAVFMGTSSDGKKALLLVSSDVESIFGDGQCVVGSQTCQLLALEEGLPETFVYGPQARTYRIEILKIEKTLSAKPRRAALGAPKKRQKKGQSKPASG